MEDNNVKSYGLLTAISMIVGTVIGSGIYFKADDILSFTGGNVALGILVIFLGALNIIFGSLTLSQLAQRDSKSGGIAGFAETYYNQTMATIIGLFQCFVYIPVVTMIISWVAASYTWSLIDPSASFEKQIGLAFIYLIFIALMNYFSKIIAGYFQSLSTFVKVIPLIIVIITGLFWNQPHPTLPTNYQLVSPSPVGFGWLAALVPLAFTFDGWNVVTNIAPELKNPKRNLPLAYILGPITILILYVCYFIGLNNILGESFILSTGNNAVQYAFNMVLGEQVGKYLIVFVIFSVLGVANGMFLANIRLPQAMGEKGWLHTDKFTVLDPKYQLSLNSTILSFIVTTIWLIIHYIVFKYNLLPNSDVSESAVVFNSLCLLPIYLVVIRLYRTGQIKNKFFGLVAPIVASFGILIIVLGNFILNFKAALLTTIFGLILFILFGLYAKYSEKINRK